MDLKQKMLVASCDVKDSIMSIELMQDKQHETTALLVSTRMCLIYIYMYDVVILFEAFLEHMLKFVVVLRSMLAC